MDETDARIRRISALDMADRILQRFFNMEKGLGIYMDELRPLVREIEKILRE